MEQVDFFPLIAGFVGSHSPTTGIALHYTVALTIGVSFGLLFQREIRGLGSSLGWGAAYGTLWWFIGPLRLLPLLTRAPLDWSYAHDSALFGSLVGHIIYGLILGTLYAAIDRIWVRVFYESDPLNRAPAGPGLQTIHALQWGLAGGALGALGALLVRATSAVMMLHERAAYHGGPLTLAPVLHGLPFRWTPQASTAALPDLVGDLLFGLITAAVYLALERRHRRWLAIDRRYAARIIRGSVRPCAVTLPLFS